MSTWANLTAPGDVPYMIGVVMLSSPILFVSQAVMESRS